jgi:hypothetical protein
MSHDKSTLVPDAHQASRRSLLMGLAAAAAIPGPTVASAMGELPASPGARPDPIFAAIAAEREAYAAYCATNEVQKRISDQDPYPPPVRNGVHDYEANENRLANPAHKAWWAEYREAEALHKESAQDLYDARTDFLTTRPTTIAGLLAFVVHIEGPFSTGETGEALWDETEWQVAIPTLTAAVRELICEAQP